MPKPPAPVELPFFAHPAVGSALTVLSGLSLLFLCTILPLVGKAGAAAPHTQKNFVAFLGVLLLSFVLAGGAVLSKMARRKLDGSPLPAFSLGLCALYTVLLFALMTGLLRI